ncbi:hypothetical protein BGX31_006568 [Mortierella sp. GBA43]|nr:hypothetical protein BGX31_006568 [Mortierella sp. GBA43]
MAKVDLVVAEAQYVAAMKRVEASLNQATENLGAAGRKDKDAIRLMIDRWSEMIKLHTKFHDDVNTMNEDLRGVAGLLNSLLVNLEPMLVSHSRDLPLTLKKLTRRDQNPEHVLAEWNSALRQPFEHLTSYGDWLQRVDPHSSFSQDCRTLLDGVIYKIHNAGDSHQPRNVLRRLSTIARMVTKRCSLGSSPPTPTRPNAPIDMDGPTLSFVEKLEDAPDYRYETVQDLEIARNDEVLETNPPLNVGHGQEKKLPALPTGVVADLTNGPTASSVNGIQHRMSRLSGLSNSGTLTTKDSSSRLSSSSSSSVRTKVSSFSETPRGKPSSASSAQIGEKIMAERESRKASLRVGTSDTIQARANSLQSTTCLIRPSIEGLRKVSSSSSSPSSTVTNAKNNKPPVQSLIAFWEQV